mmetsp:Transcript_8551/g.13176  ORF Transcript_8551/g.13176 Transcript_8551/m.13176 type:complete len:245 (-) Transcript_8551:1064-1798(-)|eukprot:CAMPEP_0178895092 /NCGR_PEP_ID=MMETSP0786-20121207/385_1 /TAXON_ID=186022 /ORGANISM="Thalassionema frauenfeldii, Strain CCMP 1798" /LENGTH=244 /DNA_ID=CAMNT_0020565265 /DNA_START=99 /DNA_END=833 /DNA_ORIENTATION=+
MPTSTPDLKNLIRSLQNETIAQEKLSLRGREIDDSDVILLVDTLLKYPKKNITSIDLSFNNIGPTGAEAVGKLLGQNNFLIEFDLRNNSIGSKGAEALGKALEGNTTLTDIYLSYNFIGDRGAQHLLQSLKYNSTLTWVGRLYGNDLSEDLMKDVMNLVSENNNGHRTQIVNLHRAQRVFPSLVQKCPLARCLVFELQKRIWEMCFGEIHVATNIHNYPPDLKLVWENSLSKKRSRDEMEEQTA